MKRGRNQRRRQGGNPNRALDSNGPDVRIRGTANQIHDKYQTLARDAQSAGDRVKAENYLQHAEHYFRLMKALQPTPQPQQDSAEQGGDQPSVSQDREERDNRDDRGRRPRHNNRDKNQLQSRLLKSLRLWMKRFRLKSRKQSQFVSRRENVEHRVQLNRLRLRKKKMK